MKRKILLVSTLLLALTACNGGNIKVTEETPPKAGETKTCYKIIDNRLFPATVSNWCTNGDPYNVGDVLPNNYR